MSKINIHRSTFLEKEELTRMITFLNEKPEISAVLASSVSFGLVSPGGRVGSPFKVTASTTLGSINMVGGYVIGSDLRGYKVDSQLDFPIPNDQRYYWLKVGPDSKNYEDGTVQVDTSGNVSGSVNFIGIVRGQSSGVPTCIRFVKEDGSAPLNNQVYQIVDIINANNVILSSGVAFQAETDLRVIILGSIPMGRRFTDEQLEGLYTFDTYKLSLVQEPAGGTMPDKEANEYFISRIQNNGGSVTVLDERTQFWTMGGSGGSSDTYTFVINPTPADARVIIDGVITSGVEAVPGRTLIWSVSKPGYLTKSGNYTMGIQNETLNVVLEVDPDPFQQVDIVVKTMTGNTTQGGVAINNSVTINKAEESITVLSGTVVQICAQASAGYRFAGWLRGSEAYNQIAIQEVPAIVDTTYTATFVEASESDYWNFETSTTNGHELFTVPTPAGSGEYEGVMVKIEED